MISTMDRQLISQWFAYVRPMYWPVLCLEIVRFYLWAWADAETHGFARQVIVAVNDHGRIRVRFIEDAPEALDDWQRRLSNLSAMASRLTASSPLDLIEGPISVAVSAFLERLPSPKAAVVETSARAPPLIDPG